MMLVSYATVASLNVLTYVLPAESVRRLATFLEIEVPSYQLTAGVGQTER